MPEDTAQRYNYTPIDNEMLYARALEQARHHDELENAEDTSAQQDEPEHTDTIEDESPAENNTSLLAARREVKKYLREALRNLRRKKSHIDTMGDFADGMVSFGAGCNTLPVIGTLVGVLPLTIGNVVKYFSAAKYRAIEKEQQRLEILVRQYHIPFPEGIVRGYFKKILSGYFRPQRWLFMGLGIMLGVGVIVLIISAATAAIIDIVT